MKKVLITGASGFIGSKLVKHLCKDSYEVGIIVRTNSSLHLLDDVINNLNVYRIDLNYNSINNAIKSFMPDVTIHLASLFINEHRTDQIKDLIESNILFGSFLLESLTSNNCLQFINTGTSWQHYNNEAYNPANLYAATKQAFDDIIRYYIEAKGLNVIALKIFDTYAVDDPRPKVFSLLKRIAETGEKIDMSGGEQEVEFIHVDDVVEAYHICLKKMLNQPELKYLEYGIGTGHPKTLKNWVKEYELFLKKPLNVNWGGRPYRAREVMTSWKTFKKIDDLDINKDIFNQ